jgi:hypothetical protein
MGFTPILKSGSVSPTPTIAAYAEMVGDLPKERIKKLSLNV